MGSCMVEVIYVRARLIPVPHTGGVHINAPMDERKRSSDKSVDNQQRNEDTADRGRLVRTTPISAACAAGAGGESGAHRAGHMLHGHHQGRRHGRSQTSLSVDEVQATNTARDNPLCARRISPKNKEESLEDPILPTAPPCTFFWRLLYTT